MVIQTGDNKFGVAQWIVDPVAGLGTHTTIAGAIASASAGEAIFIRPGVYSEDLTLIAGISLTGTTGSQNVPLSQIVGKITAAYEGRVHLENLSIETNSDFALEVSGSDATLLFVENCTLTGSDNTIIDFSSSSSSSLLYIESCQIDLLTTGVAFYSQTSAGSLVFLSSGLSNSGGSTTVSDTSNGTISFGYCSVAAPVSASSGCDGGTWYNTPFNTRLLNVTPATIDIGGVTINSWGCNFDAGTATALVVTSGQITLLRGTQIRSTNAAVISGAGTISYDYIVFPEGGSNVTVTTQTPVPTEPRSGILVQQVRNSSTAAFSTSVAIPADGTIPQITEGGEFITQAITPLSASNILRIEISLQFDLAVNPVGTAALFVDSTANALAAFPFSTSIGGYRKTFTAVYYTTAGSTTSRTYRVRVGLTTANAVTINPNVYGGVNFSSITVSEFIP